jgi:hypothetical protein
VQRLCHPANLGGVSAGDQIQSRMLKFDQNREHFVHFVIEMGF